MNRILKKLRPFKEFDYASSRFYSQKQEVIKKSVFISQSQDVFINLAMEDWLYKNNDFTSHHVLMLWRNDPCVVIGRHQNPWEEVNLSELKKQGILLARRNSGGGTVYHDPGNLNLTFFTSRKLYDRLYNLELISSAIFKQFDLKLSISKTFDIFCRENFKVSGTASKLGRNTAYHHCTLLTQVDKTKLKQVLSKQQVDLFHSNATKSKPSPIMNLSEENPDINIDKLMAAVGWEYLRTNPVVLKDEGLNYLKHQTGFQLINPKEEWFPGLTEIYENLTKWDWCYGKTPKFSVNRSYSIPVQLLGQLSTDGQDLKIKIVVENGKITEVILNIPHGLTSEGISGETSLKTNLQGLQLTDESIKDLNISLDGMKFINADMERFVAECFHEILSSV